MSTVLTRGPEGGGHEPIPGLLGDPAGALAGRRGGGWGGGGGARGAGGWRAPCGWAGAGGGPGGSPAAAAGPSVQGGGSPPPSPVLGYRLNAVAALSAASAWAVGLSNQGTIHPIRWDGRNWQRVPASGG